MVAWEVEGGPEPSIPLVLRGALILEFGPSAQKGAKRGQKGVKMAKKARLTAVLRVLSE